MSSVVDEVKEPLEKRVRADCGSCKGEKVYFNYIGLNKLILDNPAMADFLIKKYGNGSLFLYGCSSCSTSMTLASLKPYPN